MYLYTFRLGDKNHICTHLRVKARTTDQAIEIANLVLSERRYPVPFFLHDLLEVCFVYIHWTVRVDETFIVSVQALSEDDDEVDS
jgi:hypothetical protein